MSESISDERLAEIRQIAADSRAVVARHLTAALGELLAEVDRLNTVLDANRIVRNAAESSSRTYKAVTERLKAERTRLRAELDKCAALNRNLVNENAELSAELEQLREERRDEPEPRCAVLSNTRLRLQCSRPEGHDGTHVANLDGMGRFSWNGD